MAVADVSSSIGEPDRVPSVVIVGRPNVGKSTLFNRIIGEQAAIVQDQPGVTRDRQVRRAEWLGTSFDLVDTGGWLPSGSELDAKVSRQVEQAVRSADLVLLCVDASVGLVDDDAAVASWLRRSGVTVLVVANKADNDRRELERWEFVSLGLGDPVPVSALHGRRGRCRGRWAAPASYRPGREAQRWQEHIVQPTRRRRSQCGARYAGNDA
jgi:GTP-binding protein